MAGSPARIGQGIAAVFRVCAYRVSHNVCYFPGSGAVPNPVSISLKPGTSLFFISNMSVFEENGSFLLWGASQKMPHPCIDLDCGIFN